MATGQHAAREVRPISGAVEPGEAARRFAGPGHEAAAFTIRPAASRDVAIALAHASRHGLAVAFRGAGHAMTAGSIAPGGMLIASRRRDAPRRRPVAAAPSEQGRAESSRPLAPQPAAAAPAPRRATPGHRPAPTGDSPSAEPPRLTRNDLELEEDVRDFLGRECLRKELLSEREQNDKFLRSFTEAGGARALDPQVDRPLHRAAVVERE